MKVQKLIVIIQILVFTQLIFCQTQEVSDSAKILSEKVAQGDNQSILDAGKTGDKTLVPYLKTLALKGSSWAQMALAKLGEKEYLDQILAEVDDKNPNIQNKAMRKMAYVGGKEIFAKFYQLLDDTAPRENPNCQKNSESVNKNTAECEDCNLSCDVIYFSRSVTAMKFLSKMVDNPPNTRGTVKIEEQVRIWKEWFLVNGYLPQ